ncbi:MAG: methyl-accepting chemotaxis protein [Peptococcaceae bacterium]|nr:methyl-accepting chemotaxis protein [Peptococcaceae bacterium]
MNSLRVRLMFIIVVVTTLILGAVSYINIQKTKAILSATLSTSAVDNADHNAKLVNEWLQGIVNEAKALAQTPEVQSLDKGRYLSILKGVIANHKDYSLIYVADKTGNSYGTSEMVFDVSTRDYFMAAMQGKTVISDPVMGKSTGKLVFVVATPVYRGGEKTPAGIVGISVTLEYLQELVSSMKLSGYGYGFIQHPNMTTIAHPDQELLGNNKLFEIGDDRLKENLQRMGKGEKGYSQYALNGEEKFMAFAPVPLTNWSVAQTANIKDVMLPLNIIRNANLLVTAIAVFVMLGIAFIIAGYISGPITRVSQAAEAIAGGDLSLKMDLDYKGKDEIGVLTASFAKMVDNLKAMITDIRNNSEKLAFHSQELASTSEEVSATVEEVASTTSEVAATSAQEAENAEEAASESEQMRQVAQEGSRAVRNTIEKINAIASASQEVSGAVQKLGDQSKRIGEIISTITNIAEQTNLLALNAAIEAARAGEQGRGFAVVAEEVRHLAEQSADAAREITGLINEIQSGVNEAVSAMDHGTAEVNEGVQAAGGAGAAIEQIIKAIEKNTNMIKELASGARQSSEGTQQLTAAGEQIASAVHQVSNTAQELSRIAEELQKAVIKFKI